MSKVTDSKGNPIVSGVYARVLPPHRLSRYKLGYIREVRENAVRIGFGAGHISFWVSPRQIEVEGLRRNSSINDTFGTMSDVIAHRFCINPEAVKRWLERNGYGVEDFGEVISKINSNFEHWLVEVIECSKGVDDV